MFTSEDFKKMSPFEILQGLRKQNVSEWVICYLGLLHAFGNEAAHHKTRNTYPPEISDHDLALCLFAIQRVLDFWFAVRGPVKLAHEIGWLAGPDTSQRPTG
jgi:hypothetical protein